jgi:hypothetical protein
MTRWAVAMIAPDDDVDGAPVLHARSSSTAGTAVWLHRAPAVARPRDDGAVRWSIQGFP